MWYEGNEKFDLTNAFPLVIDSKSKWSSSFLNRNKPLCSESFDPTTGTNEREFHFITDLTLGTFHNQDTGLVCCSPRL